MNQNFDTKIESKIHEDLSPTKNLTGLHLKIVAADSNYLVLISTLVCIPISILV